MVGITDEAIILIFIGLATLLCLIAPFLSRIADRADEREARLNPENRIMFDGDDFM